MTPRRFALFTAGLLFTASLAYSAILTSAAVTSSEESIPLTDSDRIALMLASNTSGDGNISPYDTPMTAGPEPTTLVLCGSVLLGLGLLRKKLKP